jgi:arsenate reductase-like glutaredoxin family protein
VLAGKATLRTSVFVCHRWITQSQSDLEVEEISVKPPSESELDEAVNDPDVDMIERTTSWAGAHAEERDRRRG